MIEAQSTTEELQKEIARLENVHVLEEGLYRERDKWRGLLSSLQVKNKALAKLQEAAVLHGQDSLEFRYAVDSDEHHTRSLVNNIANNIYSAYVFDSGESKAKITLYEFLGFVSSVVVEGVEDYLQSGREFYQSDADKLNTRLELIGIPQVAVPENITHDSFKVFLFWYEQFSKISRSLHKKLIEHPDVTTGEIIKQIDKLVRGCGREIRNAIEVFVGRVLNNQLLSNLPRLEEIRQLCEERLRAAESEIEHHQTLFEQTNEREYELGLEYNYATHKLKKSSR